MNQEVESLRDERIEGFFVRCDELDCCGLIRRRICSRNVQLP